MWRRQLATARWSIPIAEPEESLEEINPSETGARPEVKPKKGLSALLQDSLLWRLMRESIPSQRKKYEVAVVAMVLVAGASAAAAWVMGEIVNAMTNPSRDGEVYYVAALVFIIFTVRGFASFFQVVYMTRAGNRIVAEKQYQIYQKMLGQGVVFFNKRESSDLLMRVTQSAQRARQVIDTVVQSFIRDTLTLLGLLGVMFYQQPFLSAISLLIGPFIFLGLRRILAKVKEATQLEMAGITEVMRVVQETSGGSRVIKAFALEERMEGRMDSAVREVEERANRIARLGAATTPLLDTLTGFVIGAIVVVSSLALFGQDPGNAGQLMSFVTALIMAYEPAKRLSRMRVTIEAGMAGVRMMYDIIDQPETMVEAPDAKPLPRGAGEIRFDNVSFGYNKGASIINGVDFTFKAGTTTALVGPSGGGKTTLMNLAMRLFDPTEGRVLIDGNDIRQATFASLRDQIGFVGQDTFLFSDTILENLRMGRPGATDDEVHEAARIANADQFIQDLPRGYETRVGENGAFLSGGQKQRLAIARAVLREAPILLLDEATSALDSHSEALVRDALDQVTKDVTTIVIAHRLSTILSADYACYVEKGAIVEHGTLNDLRGREGGRVRALFDQQFSLDDVNVDTT